MPYFRFLFYVLFELLYLICFQTSEGAVPQEDLLNPPCFMCHVIQFSLWLLFTLFSFLNYLAGTGGESIYGGKFAGEELS